ncbi:hypothetical protein [Streptomyces sp. H27-D2]|nr:hypothetical protein [Streptomyces sp. H27-D2]MEC4017418.1 hypothetical protein [Streptomyces sp. H27-D2]
MRDEAGPEKYRLWRRSLHGTQGPMDATALALLRTDPRYAALPPEAVPA